jgi:D-alanyl-D-alanine carboxypeptidase (penicillin-binding protein 5/6)
MAKGYFFSFSKRRGSHTILWALLIVVILFAALFGVLKVSDAKAEKQMTALVAHATRNMQQEANSVQASITLAEPVHSKSYILLRLSDYSKEFEGKDGWLTDADAQQTDDAYLHNRILTGVKENKKIYPASMVKILTSLIIIENVKDFDEIITLTESDFVHLYKDGASVAGFEIGDQLSVRDLLYGVLIKSGSECTTALSKLVAGDEETFVGMMNDKAAEIGMADSHFTNPTGLQDKNNYSTVSDLALALSYAIRNPAFYELFTTQEYTTAPPNGKKDGYELKSTLFQKEGLKLEYPDGAILGGKTGYTSDAGQCLASLFIKDEVSFILVTAAAMPDNFRTEALHVDDLLTVYKQVKVTVNGTFTGS